MTYQLADCHLIDLPKIHDPRGNLTFIEGGSLFRSTFSGCITCTTSRVGQSGAGMRTRRCTS